VIEAMTDKVKSLSPARPDRPPSNPQQTTKVLGRFADIY
jgi:hypothetical protein